MTAPPVISQLIETFHRNRDSYRSPAYNEHQLRVEFLDPFFIALGWDVYNAAGYALPCRDVVHEDAIKIGAATKAPDYCFRVGGGRKFFLEAKKPALDIGRAPEPAFQLRRYAWSAKLSLSILSNFEELAVYDCRVKPEPSDQAATARLSFYGCADYLERWPEIEGVFSKEAVLKGSFDKFAESAKKKKGTAEVDAAFLKEIESWREALAKNIALRNSLSTREVNFAVQATLDRIIFLRICEDRGIENYGILQALLNGQNLYRRLFQLFDHADDKYNSGLFHFKPEKNRPEPDALTPRLVVDDKPLKEIIRRLYYPESPYEFSVLPADILGQVYEQFLGKVIRLTAGGQAKIEDKPEVKKAGGVYYTPTYIVDYIVKQTVGKLVEGLKPGPRGAAGQVKLLDPACGSGSFLLGAYQFLLDWQLAHYLTDGPEKWARGRSPTMYQAATGDWRLTGDERKRILLNHIYGVDIDPQAVEVTKLSLLLKVLEGENEQTLGRQLSFLQERVLPDLANNIKCGNSLIGPDFYEGGQMSLLAEEELYRLNAFDWGAEFPEIMAAGGFDVVIGNPPYIRIQAMKEWSPLEVEFYKQRYAAAGKGNYDIYVVFVEKGLSLLNDQGRLGFILPHKFFNAQYGEPLRGILAQGKHLSDVVHFGDQQVFAGATTYTCLLFLNKQASNQIRFVQAHDLSAWRLGEPQTEGNVSADKVTEDEWNFIVGPGANLFWRLEEIPVKLVNIADKIFQGLVTSSDPVYLLEPLGPERDGYVPVKSNATSQEYLLEAKVVWPLCKGSLDIRRYSAHPSKRVLFPYDGITSAATGKTTLISDIDFAKNFPKAWEYLKENYEILRNRERGKMRHERWYGYVYPKSVSLFAKCKILTPSIASRASYTLDKKGELYFVGSGGGGGGGYGIILKEDVRIAYEYLLGLLNSKLLDYYLKQISTPFRGGYYAYNRQYIEQLPIRTIDFANPTDKAQHDQMVALVEMMLDLHRQLAAATIPQAKTMFRRQIEATDRQIDRLVYALYGLTEEEIRLVEGSAR